MEIQPMGEGYSDRVAIAHIEVARAQLEYGVQSFQAPELPQNHSEQLTTHQTTWYLILFVRIAFAKYSYRFEQRWETNDSRMLKM